LGRKAKCGVLADAFNLAYEDKIDTRTKIKYNIHVRALITRPMIAYTFNLSRTTATMLVTRASGGTTSKDIPPRNATGDRHPGRRTAIIANTSQGSMESPSPIFQIVALFSFCVGMASLPQTRVKQAAVNL
jgi:hypothetical protein